MCTTFTRRTYVGDRQVSAPLSPGLFLSNRILWSGNVWMTALETDSR
jgi:hypothetical protein